MNYKARNQGKKMFCAISLKLIKCLVSSLLFTVKKEEDKEKIMNLIHRAIKDVYQTAQQELPLN